MNALLHVTTLEKHQEVTQIFINLSQKVLLLLVPGTVIPTSLIVYLER
jgi:hypothetical protein